MYLSANWIDRGGLTVPVMSPKVLKSLKFRAGGAKLGWLVKLKNSARKSKKLFSVTWNFFPTPKSQLAKPGARMTPTGEFPNVPSAALAKAEGVIQLLID